MVRTGIVVWDDGDMKPPVTTQPSSNASTENSVISGNNTVLIKVFLNGFGLPLCILKGDTQQH